MYFKILTFKFKRFFTKYSQKSTLSSNFKLLHVAYTCFNLFAIEASKSSSALVFCRGGNFIPGFGYFDLAFLEVDRADVGGGGIYAWKSLYILSATKVSRISGGGGPSILWPAFTSDLF